ncbi:MAG TPA: SirB2 family protein [Burkholderiaceae bacterium]|nr:SirB2 family protein [Burkholderiaceae bacterium]
MDYSLLKTIHQAAVALSFAGFFSRGLAGLHGAAWVRSRPARTLPHAVDTVLLASALAMVWTAGLSLTAPWLLAKIAALLAYIGLGMLALRPGRPRRVRAVAWVAALAAYAYIVAVAIAQDPAGPLRWL